MGRPGWEDEYVEFFVARAPALRRTAYAMCGDWQAAEDLVQVTFVRLYVHWRRVRPDTADAYARRILTNLFLTRRRRSQRERITDQVPESGVAGVDVDTRVDLVAALARLSDRQRARVIDSYIDSLSEDEPPPPGEPSETGAAHYFIRLFLATLLGYSRPPLGVAGARGRLAELGIEWVT